jgi:hypothetical protein
MERWMDQRSGNHRCSNQGPTTTPSTKWAKAKCYEMEWI